MPINIFLFLPVTTYDNITWPHSFLSQLHISKAPFPASCTVVLLLWWHNLSTGRQTDRQTRWNNTSYICVRPATFYHDDTQRLTKWNHSDKVKPLLLLVMKSILIWINTDHVIETVYTWLNQKPMTKWVFVKVSVQSNSLTVIHTLMVAGCCGLVAARLDSRGADQTAGWAERRWRI